MLFWTNRTRYWLGLSVLWGCLLPSISHGELSIAAGDGTPGFSGDGGQAINAQLQFPFGLAVDGEDNFYIADRGNRRVRKVNVVTGIITTIAGNGVNEDDREDILAVNTGFSFPAGVSVAANGDVYIADLDNNCIRKVVAQTGIITTVAGGSGSGYTSVQENMLATEATLWSPRNVVVDASGNIFIADRENNRVRMVDAATQKISTLAEIQWPSGLALDPSGEFLYVTEARFSHKYPGSHVIRIRLSDRTVTTVVGDDGTLNGPEGIAISESGDLYVADTYNKRVHVFTSSGNAVASYPMSAAPKDLAFLPNGDLLVALAETQMVVRISFPHIPNYSLGTHVERIAGTGYEGFGVDGVPARWSAMEKATALATDPRGHVFVADVGSYRIRKIDYGTGLMSTIAGNGEHAKEDRDFTGQATQMPLGDCDGIDVDDSGEYIYALLGEINRVLRIDRQTGAIAVIAGTGDNKRWSQTQEGALATEVPFLDPSDIVVDANGNVYISETGNNRIRKIDGSTLTISTLTEAEMPRGLALDPMGERLYFTGGLAGAQVFEIELIRGGITRIAGSEDAIGFSGDGGPADQALLDGAYGITVDAFNNLYIAEEGSKCIRFVRRSDNTIWSFPTPGRPRDVALLPDNSLVVSMKLGPGLSAATRSLGEVIKIAPEAFQSLVVNLSAEPGATVPNIYLSSSSLSFGDVTTGQSATQTFTVSNNGNADLSVTGIRSSSVESYTVAPSCGARGRWDSDLRTACTLTPGSSQNVTVIFTAGTTGARHHEVIIIESNDPDQPYIELSVSGNSVLPKLGFEDVSGSARIDDIQKDGYTFDQPVQVGISDSVGIGIANRGNANLQVSDLVFSNWEGSWNIVDQWSYDGLEVEFSNAGYPASAQSFTVPPGNVVDLAIFWSPTVPGEAHGTVTILSNDPDEPSLVLNLSAEPGATGTTSGPVITSSSPVIKEEWVRFINNEYVGLPGRSYTFDNPIQVGDTHDVTLWIKNNGSTDLLVSDLVFSEWEGSGYVNQAGYPTGATSFTVPPERKVALLIRWSPTSTGEAHGTLTILSNDPETPALVLELHAIPGVADSGAGVASSLKFEQKVWLWIGHNWGDDWFSTARIDEINSKLGDVVTTIINALGLDTWSLSTQHLRTLEPLGCVITTNNQDYSITQFGRNVTKHIPEIGSNLVVFILKALADSPRIPDIALSVDSLSFGNVAIGQSLNLTLLISNTGNGRLRQCLFRC